MTFENPGTHCRLYLITPPRLTDDFAERLRTALDGGDVAALQLRLKDASDETILRAAARLMPIAHAYNVAFIVNDRADLAVQSGADGVHIGQEDGIYREARRLVGQSRIVGVTCHASRHLAMEAGEAGADYVAFGAFFKTASKHVEIKAEPGLLRWWNEIFSIPSVAIGGITVENCHILIEAGANFLAVIGGVWDYPAGPNAAIRDFNTAIANAQAD